MKLSLFMGALMDISTYCRYTAETAQVGVDKSSFIKVLIEIFLDFFLR